MIILLLWSGVAVLVRVRILTLTTKAFMCVSLILLTREMHCSSLKFSLRNGTGQRSQNDGSQCKQRKRESELVRTPYILKNIAIEY